MSLLAVLLMLFLFAATSLDARTNDKNDVKIETQELGRQKPQKTDSIAWYKKFQIEYYGGFANLNPSDLNLFVDYDNRIQEFNYEFLLNYLQSSGQIRSWSKIQDEDRRKIKNAFPIGIRLKYHLKSSIAVSLGFRYFSRKRESDFYFQYRRNEIYGDQYTESMAYSPYSLSVEAYVPQVGIHLTKKIKGALILEGFLSGGPLFIECHYISDWNYEWKIRETDGFEYLVFRSAGALEEKGKGTGITLDLGGRINYLLLKNMGIFLEGGYAYQVVQNVSGSGSEVMEDFSETWNGRWGIKKEKVAAPWGELESEFPTNRWLNDSDEEKVRNFKLGLSGLQLRLGLSFRF